MKKSYETPSMEVLAFQPRETIMDSTCTYLQCTADGICPSDGAGCIMDGAGCIMDGVGCIMDGVCLSDISGM